MSNKTEATIGDKLILYKNGLPFKTVTIVQRKLHMNVETLSKFINMPISCNDICDDFCSGCSYSCKHRNGSVS